MLYDIDILLCDYREAVERSDTKKKAKGEQTPWIPSKPPRSSMVVVVVVASSYSAVSAVVMGWSFLALGDAVGELPDWSSTRTR